MLRVIRCWTWRRYLEWEWAVYSNAVSTPLDAGADTPYATGAGVRWQFDLKPRAQERTHE